MTFLVGGCPPQARFYTAKKRIPRPMAMQNKCKKQCTAVTKAEARVGRGFKDWGSGPKTCVASCRIGQALVFLQVERN